MYACTPVVMFCQRKYKSFVRVSQLLGLVGMCIALFSSSFARTTNQLIVTQGVMYGVAACIFYCPCILYLDEWFVRKRGLAYGIMWAGTGVGGAVLPDEMSKMLRNHGFEWTMRIWATILGFSLMFMLPFIRPRVEELKENKADEKVA